MLLWTLQDKRSAFFADYDQALKFINKSMDKDLYFGVGLHQTDHYIKEYGKEGRGERKNISGIFGLYADVDIKQEKNYFRDFDEAEKFLSKLPHKPTITIHSGGGLQPYWLFKEPMMLASDAERDIAERYTKGWIKYLSEAAQHSMDSVGDITRVLRVPGSRNFKYKPPRPVLTLSGSEGFYNPIDFDEWMLPEIVKSESLKTINFTEDLTKAAKALDRLRAARFDDYTQWLQIGMSLYSLDHFGLMLWKMHSAKSAKYVEGDCEKKWSSFGKERDKAITLGSLFYWEYEDNLKQTVEIVMPKPDAFITGSVFDLLYQSSDKFKKTWERKRSDFDDNQYRYDCSLAACGITCSLDNQTIADLIIQHRRKHNRNPQEACKPGYIDKIIARIREQRRIDTEREQQIDEAKSELRNQPEITDNFASTKNSLSKLFGKSVARLHKSQADPPEYTLYLEDGLDIFLGRVNNILSFALFRERLASLTGYILPSKIKDGWEHYAQALLSIAEDEDIGPEAKEVSRARVWITHYLDDNKITPEKQPTNLTSPFLENGEVVIIGHHFVQWLNTARNEKTNGKEVGRILRRAGCEHIVVYKKIGGKRETTRYSWRVPREIYAFSDPV